jgi:hypothetical protein
MPFILTAKGERIELKHPWTRHGMKPRDIFRDIFGLAVRLLGLVFLYFGLSGVPPLLDFGAIEMAGRSDILNIVLPIVFNLAVAWWLIGGRFLIRRAYPETSKFSDHSQAQTEGEAPMSTSAPSRALAEMETAEKKLASLVGKPKDGHAA